MVRDDGGYAYPSPIAVNSIGDVFQAGDWAQGGMTLRDYFAGQAVGGLIGIAVQTDLVFKDISVQHETLAKIAYGIADAMIAERSK